MRILKVIHGYPPYYSAGSEVYSQVLAHQFAENHEVQVFTRHENSFLADFHYHTMLDPEDARVVMHLINIPILKYRYKFIVNEVDIRFKQIIDEFKPDIIHFGHLSHLSLNLPKIAYDQGIPNIFTLHDFWLMCPRGRFIQRNSSELLRMCDGQENRKCATQCYSGYFTGDDDYYESDVAYWENWIGRRMGYVIKMIEYVDHFIAPSRFLLNKFVDEFAIPKTKISYHDYGFDLTRLQNTGKARREGWNEEFVFGYIGTHTPEKGIDLLIKAFARIVRDSDRKILLKIWGKKTVDTGAFIEIINNLPEEVKDKILWMDSYKNEDIVTDVFKHVDAIIVPSIWGENSPLVIHEAQQVRVPVITANYGGMAEYVRDGVNGLLFEHRDEQSLAQVMLRLANDSDLYNQLKETGYLYSSDGSEGNVPDIKDHANVLEGIYHDIIKQKNKSQPASRPGPWRITFDTNPDYCNYSCIMCECFSPYSKEQENKKLNGIKPKMMPIETIRKVVENAVGTPLREIIPSTMGEPLLYKHFEEIIDICRQYNLKLNLTTNGSFPIRGVEQWAKLLLPVLSDIKISWNGASKTTQEAIMQGARWENTLNNLKTFLDMREEYSKQFGNKCSVTLQLTFLKTNIDELYDIVKMAIELGVDRVKGHHLWAHFSEIKNLSMRTDAEAIARWNVEVKKLYQLREDKLLPSGNKIILENFTLLNEQAVEDLAPGGPCPFLGKEAWVNHEGKFSPCCAPDKLRQTLGNFGNVNETTIQDIWQSQGYKELQKNYLQHNLCKTCNMRKPLVI